ncbi:hypothetical protein [Lentzea sp. NPDC059081]|uniref:hypothetical protein n=1 Tax=Lentzea sp. NPDC059081 TaxID=3346719 RepID=UPI0036A70A49
MSQRGIDDEIKKADDGKQERKDDLELLELKSVKHDDDVIVEIGSPPDRPRKRREMKDEDSDDEAVTVLITEIRDLTKITSDRDWASVTADDDAASIKAVVKKAMRNVLSQYPMRKDSERYLNIRNIAMAEARAIMDFHNRERANADRNIGKQKHLVRSHGGSSAKWTAGANVAKGVITTLSGIGLVVVGTYNVQSFQERADYEIPGPDPGPHFNATTNSTVTVPETGDHATRDWARLAAIGVGAAAVLMGITTTLTALVDLTTSIGGALATTEIEMDLEEGTAAQDPITSTLTEITKAQTALSNSRTDLRTANAAALEGRSKLTLAEAEKLKAQLLIIEARISVLRQLYDKYSAARDEVVVRHPKIGDLMPKPALKKL